jgi:hypothetical protein
MNKVLIVKLTASCSFQFVIPMKGASRDKDLDGIHGESVIRDCVTQGIHSISSVAKKELDNNSPLA